MARATETLDTMPAPNSATAATAANYLYSRLLRFKTGVGSLPTGELEGDAAQSFEVSPDKLTITLKLRQGVKFDQRAPTNGRVLDAKDVMFSLNRFKAQSTFKNELFKTETAPGPIESFSNPDANTVVLKLSKPDSLVLMLLANPRYLYMQPVEAEGGFDPKTDARGSGPWTLKKLNQSAGIEFERNPNWYGKADKPYFDGLNIAFLAEYSAMLAQFKAKNVWSGEFVRKEDVLDLKRESPELVVNSGQFPRSAYKMLFGIQDQSSPFKDERVRQATSMGVDRDLVIDVFENVNQLAKDGLELPTRWHSPIPAGWDGAWLDPRGKDFGPNAQYYKYDVAEAKKLLAAAGHANGFDFDYHYTSNGYDTFYLKQVDIWQGMFQGIGLRPKMLPEDYTTTFLPGLRNNGKFLGAKLSGSSAQGDPIEMVSLHYHSEGGFGQHQVAFQHEPDVDKMVNDMRSEFDSAKRIQLLQEFQRTMSKRMRMIWHAGVAPTLRLSWPWLANYSAFTTYNETAAGTEAFPHWWYDASQRK
jgi:peptide/nickel transport system substrate-binding protein